MQIRQRKCPLYRTTASLTRCCPIANKLVFMYCRGFLRASASLFLEEFFFSEKKLPLPTSFQHGFFSHGIFEYHFCTYCCCILVQPSRTFVPNGLIGYGSVLLFRCSAIISSDNGLSPVQHQIFLDQYTLSHWFTAAIWNNQNSLR